MRLFLKVWGMPGALLLGGYLFLSAADTVAASRYLSGLESLVANAGIASAGAGVLLAGWNLWRVWRAYKGIGESCHLCGYPVSHIANGKYGPYYKCWNCGINRADR